MKKVYGIFILLISFFTLMGCNEFNINKKADDSQPPSIDDVPFEVMRSNTYADDTYGYDKVFEYGEIFNVYEFVETNNLNTDDDYLVIDNYSDFLRVYTEITSVEIEPLPPEEGDKLFENKVELIFVRRAPSSSRIKVIYQFDSNNNELIKSYPYENDPGDGAIFYCLDIVTVSKRNYNSMISSDSIPFTIFNDAGIKKFYGQFDVFINGVEGFPFVVITEDVYTSKSFEVVHEKYDEEYFKTYSLGIVNFKTCSSEKSLELKTIKFENNKLVTIFDVASPEVNTEDFVVRNFIFQVKKEDIKKFKLSSYDIEIKVNNILDSSRGSYHYDKYEKDNEFRKDYKLTINDYNELLIENLNDTYKEGENVVVKTAILLDAGIEAFLNNRSIGSEIYVIDNDGGHWEFYFTMPEGDATLSLRVYDGFNNYHEYVKKYLSSDLLSHYTQNEIVYNYIFKNGRTPYEDEKGYIARYCGYYNNTFVVMMESTMFDHADVLGEETIGGVTFYYGNSNRLLAYNDGEFYRLQEAFDKGLLTYDDLVNAALFPNQKYLLNEIEITIEMVNEIKLAYALKYSQSPKPITVEEINNLRIRHYHGCYNGYQIVMLDGYFAYTQALRSEIVGGVVIRYADGNSLYAYQNGVFYSLREAYDNNFITKEDLENIGLLHQTSKAFDINIIE